MRPTAARGGRLVALAASAALLAGCATVRASSYAAPGLDLRPYGTYAWGAADALATGDPRLDNNEFFDARVRARVEQGLAARGLEKLMTGAPGLLVHYHASVTQRIDVRAIDLADGYCDNIDCRPYIYDAGTLFIDLVDARTRRLVWRGWGEGSLDGVIDDQALLEARIDEAVGRILARLPRRVQRGAS